jgi:hypothetical protein
MTVCCRQVTTEALCAEPGTNCGSSLIQRLWESDLIAVATGSIDRPEEFRPTQVCCGVECQVPWLNIDDELPRQTTKEAMGYEAEAWRDWPIK